MQTLGLCSVCEIGTKKKKETQDEKNHMEWMACRKRPAECSAMQLSVFLSYFCLHTFDVHSHHLHPHAINIH